MLDWEIFCAQLEDTLRVTFGDSHCRLVHPLTDDERATVVVQLPGAPPFPIGITRDVVGALSATEVVQTLIKSEILAELTEYREAGSPVRGLVTFTHGETPAPYVVWVPAA